MTRATFLSVLLASGVLCLGAPAYAQQTDENTDFETGSVTVDMAARPSSRSTATS